MDLGWALLAAAMAGGLGLAGGLLAARGRRRSAAEEERVLALTAELARAQAGLEAERRAAAERRAEAERTREQVRAEVQVISRQLLAEQGRSLLDQSQARLDALLQPVAERLRAFEATVARTYAEEGRDRATLLESLRRLQEAQGKLHADAERLARALTGESKAAGDWGEVILERVLETAGLTAGREYDLQVSHQDEEGGRKRPDALVYLPGDRAVVVDAKCSLKAFVEAMGAAEEAAREAALDAHVASVRAHVRGLAGKSYQDVLRQRTLDIVLLFVPSEAAFHAAVARDPELYADAFRQRIVVCSPTTLLAALQLIAHVWRSERQDQNARRIAEEAGRLLEKLAAFVSDLDAVGQRLDQARLAWEGARAKLATGNGNVLRRAAQVAALGARVKTEKVQELLRAGEQAPAAGEVEEPVGGAADPDLLPALAGSPERSA